MVMLINVVDHFVLDYFLSIINRCCCFCIFQVAGSGKFGRLETWEMR